ncbi:hypothetical protein MAR_025946 [Mya arenaria]|uniref:Uncharacterized protein n=1 Tax=Mya arenaria TaxID=6604 RepID=A0ABY7ESQ9_MYAAR|nr:hypothetical protein MAR_025946 [Mya arenaria]
MSRLPWAGIDSDRIKLALEPEAASIWCQQINTSLKTDLSKTGSQYMVVDLGEAKPVFVTDAKCKLLGKMSLGKGRSKEENEIEIYFLFGETELEAVEKE